MKVAVRPRAGIRAALGLGTRTQVLKNSYRRLLNQVRVHCGDHEHLRFAIDKVEKHMDQKLVSSMRIHLYSDRTIFLRMSAEVDWEKHEYMVATEGATLSNDAEFVTPSTSEFIDYLSDVLERITSTHRVSDIHITYGLNQAMIGKLGIDEVRRRAELFPLSDKMMKHFSSFEAFRGPWDRDARLQEFSYGVELGRSDPKPS